MGASGSRIEEDKAGQLCRERKKFVRQALDGRCSLAATHVAYIEALKATGIALRKFIEPEAPAESSLYTSTSITPDPLVITNKSVSQFSFSSSSASQHADETEHLSPSPSLPTSRRYQANHMKFGGMFSRKVEEKPSVPVLGSVTSSTLNATTPHSAERPEASSFETSSNLTEPTETTPWDYFGFFHPADSHLSSNEGREYSQGFENSDDIHQLREEEGIPDLEDEEEKVSNNAREDSRESEDEFDEPSTVTLVRSFENVNRVSDHAAMCASGDMPPAESEVLETEGFNIEKTNSPDLSPLTPASAGVKSFGEVKTTLVKEDGSEKKAASKDFFSSMKDIESLFVKASDSGREVPRMLEANKFHFRPIFPGKESGSMPMTLLKACFSCGDDPSQVQEEPPQNSIKYLTWHRTTSSRSSSSRNLLGADSKDDVQDLTSNLFDNFCMISGSHASTLDRLYAWEKKLYDEVKACGMIRREYDRKCKRLRQLESKGESPHRIDKVRAVVKDLHSRIRVAIHRIDSISKKIEELRDKELQPQLEELIEGLSKMWEVMFDCHKQQFSIISIAYSNGNTKLSIHSDSHRLITIQLESDLSSLSSSFTKWIGAQKAYVEAIDKWLFKCVSLPQRPSRGKRKMKPPPYRNYGPPIYVTCGVWLEKLGCLPTEQVAGSIKGLAAEIARFVPQQEKNQPKGVNHWQASSNGGAGFHILRDETADDWITSFDRFRSSLVGFLGQLSNFAESSANMYTELQKTTQAAKTNYHRSSSNNNGLSQERDESVAAATMVDGATPNE